MKINLIVEDVFEIPGDPYPTVDYNEYLFKTITCEKPKDRTKIGWGMGNKMLMYHFIKNGYVCVVNRNSYVDQPNSYYLVSIRDQNDLTNANFLNNITQDVVDFLRITRIPILLWYPLEHSGNIDDIITTGLEIRKKLKVDNKILLCALNTYKDSQGYDINFGSIDNNIENFEMVPSLGFLINYGFSKTNGISLSEQFRKENKSILNVDELYKNSKKYDFLCLNSFPRFNRHILLQSLYLNEKLWSSNIITIKHDVNKIEGYKEILIKHLIHSLAIERDLIFDLELKELPNYNNNLINYVGKNPLINFIKNLFTSIKFNNLYPPRILDDVESNLNDIFDKEWFQQTFFSLVTETYCLQNTIRKKIELPMITEKTVKAIYNFHPFIIFGHNGSHKLLNSLGFKTYEYLINLPNDSMPNNQSTIERLYNLIECLNKFDKNTIDLNRLKEDAMYNYNHLNSVDWCQKQIDLILKA